MPKFGPTNAANAMTPAFRHSAPENNTGRGNPPPPDARLVSPGLSAGAFSSCGLLQNVRAGGEELFGPVNAAQQGLRVAKSSDGEETRRPRASTGAFYVARGVTSMGEHARTNKRRGLVVADCDKLVSSLRNNIRLLAGICLSPRPAKISKHPSCLPENCEK